MSDSSTTFILEPKEQEEHKDRLSTLTDDILVFILSLMDTKDATRTCILSKSWRFLATYLPDIKFDAPQTLLLECKSMGKPIKDATPRFLDSVNRAVTSFRAPFINEFSISFPLDETHSNCIDMWIKFAISKQVKKLELNFRGIREFPRRFGYTLKYNVLDGISHLTSLCLKEVKLSEDVLDLVLSRCHLLERLHIAYTDDLSKLKIINLSEKLKYLTVDCPRLKKLEIHAVSLMYFYFECYFPVEVVYASLPSLVEVHFRGFYSGSLLSKFSPIRSFSAHLSTLSFLVYADSIEEFEEDIVIPCFPNVRDLTLRVSIGDRSDDLLWLACFPKACPLLHKLKMEVQEYYTSESDTESELEDYSSEDVNPCSSEDVNPYCLEDVKQWLETKEENNATLPNLQKLVWASTFTSNVDKEYMLVLHIVKNAIQLKTFIFNPRVSGLGHNYCRDEAQFEKASTVEASRENAEKLAMVIPSHVEFVIL